MAKAVTLKNTNDEEVYPVTDISLVNGELNGARIVDASVGSDKLTPNAVWEENIKDGAVTSDKIDWTTIPQGATGLSQQNFKGYFDIGNIRVQYMNLYKTGLNTAQYGYNVWWEDWPAPFGNNYYVAIANQTSDTGNVAGNDLKVVGRETGRVQINYNHVTAIGSGNLYWGVIGIGLKPS